VMPMVKDPSRVFVFEQGGEDKYCYRLAAVDRQGKIIKRDIINADPYAAPPWTIGRVDDVLWLWPTYHELQAWDMATITRLTTGAQLIRDNPGVRGVGQRREDRLDPEAPRITGRGDALLAEFDAVLPPVERDPARTGL